MLIDKIDWHREPMNQIETKVCDQSFDLVHKFLTSMESVKPKYENEDSVELLRRTINCLMIQVCDSFICGYEINIDRDTFNQFNPEIYGLDWNYISTVVHALDIVKMIEDLSDYYEAQTEIICYKLNAGPQIIDQYSKEKSEFLDYSEQFDVHRWSDYPEVNTFIDTIFDEYFEGFNPKWQKPRIKPILLDLYVKWREDPDIKVAISRDKNAFENKNSRYSQIHMSKETPNILDRLEEVGLIYQARGFIDRSRGIGRTTRIWPTAELRRMFTNQLQAAGVDEYAISYHPDQEVIILRDDVPDAKGAAKARDIDYADTDETNRMREVVRDYNDLIFNSFIDIPSLEERFIRLSGEGGKPESILRVNQDDKLTRRIFNRGSFSKGGRFFGGWWQRCPKEWRQEIFINDQPVSEIDYSGLHIVMLYAMKGIDYWAGIGSDPYDIQLDDFPEIQSSKRSLAKQLLLVALNAKEDQSAYAAFRDSAATGSAEKRLTNNDLSKVLDALKERHQAIADHIASDAGIDLMNFDSQITENIVQYFITQEIPILTIHDSYLIPVGLEAELEQQMHQAFETVMGIGAVRLKEETENPWRWEPLDEDSGIDPTAWAAHVEARFNPPRSERYKSEMERFLSAKGLKSFTATDE